MKRGIVTDGPDFVPTPAPNIGERIEEEIAREVPETLARRPADVQPTGVTLPLPWEEYRREGEFAEHEALLRAVQNAQAEITLTPQRYAELMWLIDSWFVEDRHELRRSAFTWG